MKNRKLRMGMVGGGRGAFIGGVHRRAAGLDGQIELVAGAFPRIQKNLPSPEGFLYRSVQGVCLLQRNGQEGASLPLGERIDFVSIVVRIICTSKWLRPFLRQESM